MDTTAVNPEHNTSTESSNRPKRRPGNRKPRNSQERKRTPAPVTDENAGIDSANAAEQTANVDTSNANEQLSNSNQTANRNKESAPAVEEAQVQQAEAVADTVSSLEPQVADISAQETVTQESAEQSAAPNTAPIEETSEVSSQHTEPKTQQVTEQTTEINDAPAEAPAEEQTFPEEAPVAKTSEPEVKEAAIEVVTAPAAAVAPAPVKTVKAVSAPVVEKVKPLGRASNDPRIAPQPVQNLQISTAKPMPPALDASIVAQPDPSRPKMARAANDPRN